MMKETCGDWPVTKMLAFSKPMQLGSEKTQDMAIARSNGGKSGRGTDQRIYPWSKYFEPSRCCNQLVIQPDKSRFR